MSDIETIQFKSLINMVPEGSPQIALHEIGHYRAKPGHCLSGNNVERQAVFYLLKGSVRLQYKHNEYFLEAGSAFFIDMHAGYMINIVSDCEYIGMIVGNMSQNLLRYVEAHDRNILHGSYQISMYLENIWKLAMQNDANNVIELYVELYSLAANFLIMPDDSRINKVISYISKNYVGRIELNTLADIAGLSKCHFIRKFRQYTGMTPLSYINHVRITHSKQMLLHTDRNITDIALDVGFNDPSRFSEIFYELNSVLPRDFRKKNSF